MQRDEVIVTESDVTNLQFAATPMAVRGALSMARERWASGQVNRELCEKTEQVLAEVLNNVVEHAHADCPKGLIQMETQATEEGMICDVRDNGRAMPDGQIPSGELADISDELDDLPEGGFGWFLISAMTVDLSYDRKEGWNRLRFRIIDD